MNTETYIMTEGDKSYRMLQVGEMLQNGDEVNCGGLDGVRRWEKYDGSWGIIHPADSSHGYLPQGYYRRPIHPATDPSNVLPSIAESTPSVDAMATSIRSMIEER